MIKVAIVDDDVFVREALTSYVLRRPDEFTVLMAAASVDELAAAGVLAQSQVVLLDVMLAPGQRFDRNVERIRAAGSQVLVVTTGPTRVELHRLLAKERVSAVDKDTLTATLHDAIRVTAKGEVVVSAAIQDGAPATDDVALTERQREVFILVASGMDLKVVARQLDIAYSNVCAHVRAIRARFHDAVQSIPGLIEMHYKAIELGLIDPNSI